MRAGKRRRVTELGLHASPWQSGRVQGTGSREVKEAEPWEEGVLEEPGSQGTFNMDFGQGHSVLSAAGSGVTDTRVTSQPGQGTGIHQMVRTRNGTISLGLASSLAQTGKHPCSSCRVPTPTTPTMALQSHLHS